MRSQVLYPAAQGYQRLYIPAASSCAFSQDGALERQDLSRTYLAHHELESVVIITNIIITIIMTAVIFITIIVIVIVIVIVNFIFIIISLSLLVLLLTGWRLLDQLRSIAVPLGRCTYLPPRRGTVHRAIT